MPSSPVEQRNFYLTLSVLEGQKLAHAAGFSIPSEDVQQSEVIDIINRWLVLSGIGALDAVKECSNWMISMLSDFNDWTTAEQENTKNIITSFGVGLLSHLLENEILLLNEDLIGTGNLKSNFKEFLGLLMFSIEDIHEEDEDYDE
jgi:hypothetical protein